MTDFLKQHIAILLLWTFGQTGIMYPYFGENVKDTGNSDFPTVDFIDYKLNLEHCLKTHVCSQLINKTKLPDFKIDFLALTSAMVAFGLFIDLTFRTWLENDFIFFDVIQLLYPFHHFW